MPGTLFAPIFLSEIYRKYTFLVLFVTNLYLLKCKFNIKIKKRWVRAGTVPSKGAIVMNLVSNISSGKHQSTKKSTNLKFFSVDKVQI